MPDSDWFPAVLTQLTATPSNNRRLHDLWAKCDMLNGSTHMRTRTISLVALLKKRIKHWCFVYDPLNREPGDEVLCSVRPALIPVWSSSAQRCTENDDDGVLRKQLNAIRIGFGDQFTALPGNFDDGSAFGAHWGHIQIDKQSGRVDCSLCAAASHSIGFYRSQAQLFISRFEERLRQKQTMWSIEENRTHEEVQSLSNAFYTSHFPEGAYISSESLLWANVRVLRHMCQHGKFLRQGPFGCVQLPEDSNELLLRSLSSRYLHQCRSFYQPLKKLLARQFKYVGRAQIDATIAHDPLSSRQGRVVEFVGGFDPSSQLLCGVFCSFQ